MIVVLEVFYDLLSDHTFKNLYEMAGQGNWSVICWNGFVPSPLWIGVMMASSFGWGIIPESKERR